MAVRLSSITDLPASGEIQQDDVFVVALKNLTGKYLSRKATLSKFPVATTRINGFMSVADKTKLDSIDVSTIKYVLPTASDTVLGGIKVATDADKYNLAIDSETGILSARPPESYQLNAATASTLGGIKVGYTENGNKFAVKLTTSGNKANLAYVDIPNFTDNANTVGLVQKPSEANKEKFLRGDGSWVTPTNTQYGVVEKSKAGLCPALPNESSTTKFLRQDGQWAESSSVSFDDIYPIGSIYISVNENIPTTFKGTWIPVAQGRCLWGTTTGKDLSSNIEAGLPNHSHNFSYNQYRSSIRVGDWSTVHSVIDDHPESTIDSTTSTVKETTIYGKSTTVQPPAFVVSMWQRIS